MSNRLSKQQASSCLLRQKSLFAESGNSTLSRSKDQFDLASTASSVFGWVLVCRCTIDNPIQHAMMMYIYIYISHSVQRLHDDNESPFQNYSQQLRTSMWRNFGHDVALIPRTRSLPTEDTSGRESDSKGLVQTFRNNWIQIYYDVLWCFRLFYNVLRCFRL